MRKGLWLPFNIARGGLPGRAVGECFVLGRSGEGNGETKRDRGRHQTTEGRGE